MAMLEAIDSESPAVEEVERPGHEPLELLLLWAIILEVPTLGVGRPKYGST